MKIADQYIKLVEWSEEDQCYVGSSPGFIGKKGFRYLSHSLVNHFQENLLFG